MPNYGPQIAMNKGNDRYFFWLVVWNMFLFVHSVGNVIIPTDIHIFRGVGCFTTNQ